MIHADTIADGFTQSEILTYEECPYKWFLRYNLKLDGPGINYIFVIGDAWHNFAERYYKSGGEDTKLELQICKKSMTTEELAYAEQVERIYQVYADEYALFYKDDFKRWSIEGVEQIADLEIEFEGVKIRLKGKLDIIGRVVGTKTIIDHKTLTGWQSSRGWAYRFQFMFYLWMQHQIQPKDRAQQFVVNAVRKPSIRIKQTETLQAYLNRLRNEIKKEPLSYFRREKLVLVKGQMEAFQKNILQPKFRRLALISDPQTPRDLLETLVLDRHTDCCVDPITGAECAFLGICEKGHVVDNYISRKVKHTELA